MSKEDLHAQECFLFVCLKNINSACIWPTLSKFSQADSHVTFAVIHSQGTKKKAIVVILYVIVLYLIYRCCSLCQVCLKTGLFVNKLSLSALWTCVFMFIGQLRGTHLHDNRK